MERLTSHGSERREMICRYEDCDICEDNCPQMNEDNCPCLKEILEKLAEYEDLEEQRRILKLPCSVGDTVYRINKGKKEPVIPMRVIGIAIRNEIELVIQTKDIDDDNHNLYSQNSIGKTVFLTREEAEAALKE